MLNAIYDVGATLAVLGAAAWAYRIIKNEAYAWANSPLERRRVRFARALPGHWVVAAVVTLVLVGVWS